MRRFVFTMVLAMLAGLSVFPSSAFCQDPATGQDERTLEERKNEIDLSNPDQLFEVAAWAMKQKDDKVRAEGRKLMREVLELSSDHEGAHTALGHVRVGDKWFTTKSEADKARKTIMEKEMGEKGYVWFRDGWIKATEKSKWSKEWEKNDEGIWRSKEDVMREKGFVLYQGVWLQVSDEDRKRIEAHKKKSGDDILIVTTQHFVLHLMVPPKFMERYAKLAEDIHAWFLKEYNLQAPGGAMWPWPRPAHIWSFQNTQQYQDWITVYEQEYQLSDEDKKMFRDHPGGWILSSKPLALNVQQKAEDLENSIAHDIGHFLIDWYLGGRAPDWMREGFSNHVEHEHCGIGKVSCSRLSDYGGGGDVAEKAFNTKDSKARVQALVKAGEDLPVSELSKLDLNALNSSHLSKGYSIFEWLFKNDREKYLAFLDAMRKSRPGSQNSLDAVVGMVAGAIAQAFGGSSLDEFDKIWREFVKKSKASS